MVKEKNMKQRKILLFFTLIILLIDQIIKIIFYVKGLNIFSNNTIENNNGYYIVMSIIISLMIIRYISSENTFVTITTKVILCFGIAGALSNTIDRIWNKEVIVYYSLKNAVNLNLAYVYIIIAWVGMAAILTKNTMMFLKERKKRK